MPTSLWFLLSFLLSMFVIMRYLFLETKSVMQSKLGREQNL